MALQTISPIKQALIAKLRTNTSLKDGLTGGMHEGVALSGSAPPLLIYQVTYAPRVYDFSQHVTVVMGVDIWIYSNDQVEAQNLDTLVYQTLSDASLTVSGQSILYCRRVLDLSSGDVDQAGKKFYQVGGQYEIWSDQAPS